MIQKLSIVIKNCGLVLLLVACTPAQEKTSKVDVIKETLIENTKTAVRSKLKSPESYTPGEFRIVTYSNKHHYPFVVDTLKNVQYKVQHVYLAKNNFNAEIKEMAQVTFDSQLKVLFVDRFSENDDLRQVEWIKQTGYTVEPLVWK